MQVGWTSGHCQRACALRDVTCRCRQVQTGHSHRAAQVDVLHRSGIQVACGRHVAQRQAVGVVERHIVAAQHIDRTVEVVGLVQRDIATRQQVRRADQNAQGTCALCDVARRGIETQAGHLHRAAQVEVHSSLRVKLARGRHVAQVDTAVGFEADVFPSAPVETREAGHTAPVVGAQQNRVLAQRGVGFELQVAIYTQLTPGLRYTRARTDGQCAVHIQCAARLLVTTQSTVARERERAAGHLQGTATAQRADVHRLRHSVARGRGGVELDRLVGRHDHSRDVVQVRHSARLTQGVGGCPVGGVEPFASGAAHPGGRGQLRHIGCGARGERADRVVGRSVARECHAADSHRACRAHVFAVQGR